MRRLLAFLLLPLFLLTACGEPEDTLPGQPIKRRQMAFKELIRAFEPMGVMLRKGSYDANKFLALDAALMAKRDEPWFYFEPDTNRPPSKATPELWAQPEQFTREKDAFLAATDRLHAAAQTRERAQVVAAYEALLDTCQSCHRRFKQR